MTDFPKDHNQFSGGEDASVGGIAADRLRSIVDRYVRLDEEKKAIASDQKDILTEAASAGFDKKVLRQLIRIVMADNKEEIDEQAVLLDIYMRAIGA